jgi:hypothetical protein
MVKSRYAIVREGGEYHCGNYSFTKWHECEFEALDEAQRLCRKEKWKFIVLKEIIRYSIKEIPIQTEICSEVAQ